MSSSFVSPQTDPDAGSVSGSDSKKRNKLGYHRTAVACGHCRRRKIRCIPSNDPSENRCQNCIRLKKECQFYPVDQSSTTTRKSHSDSRTETPIHERNVSGESQSPDAWATDYYDTNITGVATDAVWPDRSILVQSPSGQLDGLQNLSQQQWNITTRNQMQSQFSRHNSQTDTTAGTYWMTECDPAIAVYQQQQIEHATTGAAFPQDPQLAYSHPRFQDSQHTTGRQSFSGTPTSSVVQSPNAYQEHNPTFPQNERSMTMPAVYTQPNNSGDMNVNMNRQLGPGQAQYGYNSPFPSHNTRNTQWYPQNNPQHLYPGHYLPSQHDRNRDRDQDQDQDQNHTQYPS